MSTAVAYRYLVVEKGKNTPQPFFRRLKHGHAPKVEWRSLDRRRTATNCNFGQRKLLFGEIEFLTKIHKKYNLRDVLCLYVGSAPGDHLPLLMELFPTLTFFLVDPLAHVPEVVARPQVAKIIQGVYDESTCKTVLNTLESVGKRWLILISDVRSRTGEGDRGVWKDMVAQQEWVLQYSKKPLVGYSLKFRLPLELDSERVFSYLTGSLYYQLYAPISSTETRLCRVVEPGEKLKDLRQYDASVYRDELYWFNNVGRQDVYQHGGHSRVLKQHLLGFDDGYESVAEYAIVRKYWKHYRGSKPCFRKMVRLLDHISLKITDQGLRRHPVLCAANNHVTHMKSNALHEKEPAAQERFVLFLKQIKTSLQNQKQFFSRPKSVILNAKRYTEQSKLAEKFIEKCKRLQDVYRGVVVL